MITVKEFVSDSIIQIAEGLLEAQETLGEKVKAYPKAYMSKDTWNDCDIAFDLAVSDMEASHDDAKVGVLAGFFGIGAKVSATEGNNQEASSISRLSFNIKVRFPGPAA